MSDEASPQNQNQGLLLVLSEKWQNLRDLIANMIEFGKEKVKLIAGIHRAKSVDILSFFQY